MSCKDLPQSYVLTKVVDLQNDRKTALWVNLGAFGITVVMVLAAVFFVPFSKFVSFSSPTAKDALRLFLLVPAIAVYVVTHELIHGLFFRRYGKEKPKYGFSGLYFYAGSPVFFDRRSYLISALAPVVIWFFILLVLDTILPEKYFWFFYILQIVNLSGAAGDFYIAYLARSMPADVLIRDWGYQMEFYLRAEMARKK